MNSEDLMYEISILLESTLYFAGVKREFLEEAAKKYVDIIDEVLENSQSEGVDEVIEIVEYLKKNFPQYFA